MDQAEVDTQLASLGSNAMSVLFPKDEVNQTVVAGIGNIAKSECSTSSGPYCKYR